MVKYTQAIRRQKPTNCFSVFDHFVGLALNKGLIASKKDRLFSDLQCGFRSSQSTADLLPVVSDRIAMAFYMCSATQAAVLDISKVFDRIRHNGLPQKLKCYGISGRVFRLNLFFLTNRLPVVLDGTSW